MNPTLRLAYNKLKPTPLYVYYARRVPQVALWFTGLSFIMGWPHIWLAVSNRINSVPPINRAYF